MPKIIKFKKVNNREIPNLLEHRLANAERANCGETPIDFWETVPELLEQIEAYAKKKNMSLFELKERVETILLIGCLKGVYYVY